jgi:hypothetical protein
VFTAPRLFTSTHFPDSDNIHNTETKRRPHS